MSDSPRESASPIPRHYSSGEICVRALVTRDCGLSHMYHHGDEPDAYERQLIDWTQELIHVGIGDRDNILGQIDYTYETADGDSNDEEIIALQAARDELARLVGYVPKED